MSNVYRLPCCATAAVVIALAGCNSPSTTPPNPTARVVVRQAYGMGPIVQPKLHGTLLGYAVDQHGTDGVLANYNSRSFRLSLETFDQTTGKPKIVKLGKAGTADYSIYGILAHDIGFIYHKQYELMNPVSGNKITGAWKPPISFEVSQIADNQSTPKQVMLGTDTSKPSQPTALLVTDVEKGTGKELSLDQNIFNIGTVPAMAQNPVTNEALIGADVGGRSTHPTFALVNLSTGKTKTFTGLGYGDVDGIGIDTKTNTACTTTADDAGLEIYNLKTQEDIEVLMPNSGGSELKSGSGLAVDSMHHLCIIAQPVAASGTQYSAIWVADEKGNFTEEIGGFNFWFNVTPAINPSKRIGFIVNPRPLYDTLAGFTY